MAMFEEEGYCPSNAIEQKAIELQDDFVLEELGCRRLWMVYPSEYTKEGAYVVDMLFSSIGMDVIYALKDAIPKCSYPTSLHDPDPVGKKIEIYDVAPEEILECDVVFERAGYIVALRENVEDVAMYIAKETA